MIDYPIRPDKDGEKQSNTASPLFVTSCISDRKLIASMARQQYFDLLIQMICSVSDL